MIESQNQSTTLDIYRHLKACDEDFFIRLSARVDLQSYAEKLELHSCRVEVWNQNVLIGLAASYADEGKSRAFLSSLSVLRDFRGRGIGASLIQATKNMLGERKVQEIALEVAHQDGAAQNFYRSQGFETQSDQGESGSLTMMSTLSTENRE